MSLGEGEWLYSVDMCVETRLLSWKFYIVFHYFEALNPEYTGLPVYPVESS